MRQPAAKQQEIPPRVKMRRTQGEKSESAVLDLAPGAASIRVAVRHNEPKISQIEPVDKNVNDTNWIVLINPIFQAFRKQRALTSILALNEALHSVPRTSHGNPKSRITPDPAFLHSQGHKRTFATARAAYAVNRKLGSKPSSRRALSVERYVFGSAML